MSHLGQDFQGFRHPRRRIGQAPLLRVGQPQPEEWVVHQSHPKLKDQRTDPLWYLRGDYVGLGTPREIVKEPWPKPSWDH